MTQQTLDVLPDDSRAWHRVILRGMTLADVARQMSMAEEDGDMAEYVRLGKRARIALDWTDADWDRIIDETAAQTPPPPPPPLLRCPIPDPPLPPWVPDDVRAQCPDMYKDAPHLGGYWFMPNGPDDRRRWSFRYRPRWAGLPFGVWASPSPVVAEAVAEGWGQDRRSVWRLRPAARIEAR